LQTHNIFVVYEVTDHGKTVHYLDNSRNAWFEPDLKIRNIKLSEEDGKAIQDAIVPYKEKISQMIFVMDGEKGTATDVYCGKAAQEYYKAKTAHDSSSEEESRKAILVFRWKGPHRNQEQSTRSMSGSREIESSSSDPLDKDPSASSINSSGTGYTL
jgi:hypothetical protein